MGRGDKKSKKGKQRKGSFGVSRNKNSIKARLKRSTSSSNTKKVVTAATEAVPKPKKAAKKKAEA